MFAKSLGSILQEKDGKPVLDENGQPLLEPSGGYLQISGAKVYYDTTLPANQRVLHIEIKNKETGVYEPLDPNKTYYLTTNDFLAAGGAAIPCWVALAKKDHLWMWPLLTIWQK